MRAEQSRRGPVTRRIVRGIGRMASVDEYLRYAEQCLALAAKSSNAADKARLLQMAQAWRHLAEKRDNGNGEKPGERG
jgi:hypothetical protein